MRLALHSVCLALAAFVVLAAVPIVAAGCGDEGGDLTLTTATPSGSPPSGIESGGESTGPVEDTQQRIESFGEEAEDDDRQAILGSFTSYLTALGSGDYGTACDLLSAPVQELLKRFAAAQGKNQGCEALLAELPMRVKSTAEEKANGEIVDVRIEGDRAHVLFEAPGAALYQMPLAREDGEWRASLGAPSILAPSS
jgi:hypothetical protein